MFIQLLSTQNVLISIVFLSVKSIIMKIKEWHHESLTSKGSLQKKGGFWWSQPNPHFLKLWKKGQYCTSHLGLAETKSYEKCYYTSDAEF